MPRNPQRLIDHISGATWFDITKFALKIKSSIFVLVNLKILILFDLSRGAVKEKQILSEAEHPLLCMLQSPEQFLFCSNSRAWKTPDKSSH